MAEAAGSGFFAGPVDAKIQGPYDGHNMADYEIDTYTRKLFVCGGVGIASVLPILKRMALHMEHSLKADGAPPMLKDKACSGARLTQDGLRPQPRTGGGIHTQFVPT
jgi:hypothetical protein